MQQLISSYSMVRISKSAKATCLICALAFSIAPHIRQLSAATHSDTTVSQSDFLENTIYEQLAADKSISAKHLSVEADMGEITLRGIVPSLRAKRTAEKCILGKLGVRKVVNLLEVIPEELIQNDVLLAKIVDSVLCDNPYLAGQTIAVADSGAAVILSGIVRSSFERDQAELIVERVPGVKSVINRLEVVEQYLAANEVARPQASSDPAVQELIDSYLNSQGIDSELRFSLDSNVTTGFRDSAGINIVAGWMDSLAIDTSRRILVNPETRYYESFNFLGLGIAVGKYLFKKILGKDKD